MLKHLCGFVILVSIIVFAYKYQGFYSGESFSTAKSPKVLKGRTQPTAARSTTTTTTRTTVSQKTSKPIASKSPGTSATTRTTASNSITKTTKQPDVTTTHTRNNLLDEARSSALKKIFKNNRKKTILSFTKVFGEKGWWDAPLGNEFLEHEGQSTKQCQFNHCKVTYDAKDVKISDAVLCHANELPSIKELRTARSSPRQLWVWMTNESPYSFRNRSFVSYHGFFNWTGTYMRDSDIWTPYMFIKPLTKPSPEMKKFNLAEGKDKMVLALVSNDCDSYRVKFIRALKKFIDIDLYGKCKDSVNPELSGDCRFGSKECEQLKRRYKFTLSLENAFCTDYITEKFYYNGLLAGNVPIVLNRANMSNPKIAPPNSFVNVLDFKNLKSLANHLKMLASDDEKYNKLHAWRMNYKVATKNRMCTTCEALWKRDMEIAKTGKLVHKTADVSSFWDYNRNCVAYDTESFQKYLHD